jgi:ABC-2 type transport system ATP-binding protein
LALALVGDPDLIFLDEPTTGFDPAARRHAWGTVKSLCDLGKTVFLTTHYMDEAQELADQVAIVNAGKIIASGRPHELGGRDARPAEIRFVLPQGIGLDDLPDVPVSRRELVEDHVLLVTLEAVRVANVVTGWALERGVDLAHFSVAQPTLEDIYLELTAS